MSTPLEQRQAAVALAEQDMLAAQARHRITQAAVTPAADVLFDLRASRPEPARETAMLDLIGGMASDMFVSAVTGRSFTMAGDAAATARAVGAVLANIDSPYAEPWHLCLAAYAEAAATRLALDNSTARLCASLLAD
jgi:hypothetical protein